MNQFLKNYLVFSHYMKCDSWNWKINLVLYIYIFLKNRILTGTAVKGNSGIGRQFITAIIFAVSQEYLKHAGCEYHINMIMK